MLPGTIFLRRFIVNWVQRADHVCCRAGWRVSVAGTRPQVHIVCIACFGCCLPDRSGQVVDCGICIRRVGFVPGDEVVGQGSGGSSSKRMGDGGFVEAGVCQRGTVGVGGSSFVGAQQQRSYCRCDGTGIEYRLHCLRTVDAASGDQR